MQLYTLGKKEMNASLSVKSGVVTKSYGLLGNDG